MNKDPYGPTHVEEDIADLSARVSNLERKMESIARVLVQAMEKDAEAEDGRIKHNHDDPNG